MVFGAGMLALVARELKEIPALLSPRFSQNVNVCAALETSLREVWPVLPSLGMR